MTNAPASIPDESVYFPSLVSLRAAHTELLKRHRETGEAPETLAAVAAFLRRGQATGALLDDDDDRRAAQSLLNYWTALLYRTGQEPPEATLADFDPTLAPELPDALCPYLGLDAFREDNSDVFFGRQRLIESLINHLKENRLLAVVGPSGSGKSSVVRAGLIPALQAGVPASDSADWHYLPPMFPGSNPLENLAHVTRPPEIDAAAWVPSQIVAFQLDDGYLAKLIAARGLGRVVIVVDQFEEVFTLCTDDNVRQAFVDNLVHLIRAPQARHTVILTMRTDFETQVTRLPDFEPLFEQALIRVTPLNAGELRAAIEKPAAAIGLKFEAGVVDALLRDILGEPAALPLLQFTLLKLWESRERNRVTWEAYRRLGGGRQALATSADEFYRNLIQEEQDTAKRILMRLVRPGEGLEFTSNRVRREVLFHKAEARDRVERVLDKFIRARLLRLTQGETEADDQVEVAHEALVRNWPRLVGWLEDERVAMRQRRRLTTSAEQWQEKGRDPGALLRGLLLEEARSTEDLNELENEFVQASLAAREAEAAEKLRAEQQAMQAEMAQKMAEVERQRAEEQTRAAGQLRGRLLLSLVALGIAGVMIVVAVFFAVQADQSKGRADVQASTAQAASTQAIAQQAIAEAASTQAVAQQQIAEAARQEAEAAKEKIELQTVRDLAAQAIDRQKTEPGLALLLSLEAYQRRPSADAKKALLSSLQASSGLITYLHGHQDGVIAVAVSPDGRVIASASGDGNIILWDMTTHQPLRLPLIDDSPGGVTSLAFSPDGKTLASGGCARLDPASSICAEGAIRLWDVATGQLSGQPLMHTNSVSSLAFSPIDGKTLASGGCGERDPNYYYCNQGETLLWDIASHLVRGQPLTGHTDDVTSVAFSPDGKTLASASYDYTIRLWDVATRQALSEPLLLSYWAYSVAFSPDGRQLASGNGDNSIILWDISDPKRPTLLGSPLTGHTNSVRVVAFSPDGESLASGSDDNTIRLWDVTTRQLRDEITTSVTSLAFTPDGQVLVSGNSDGDLLLWAVNAPRANRLGRILAGGALDTGESGAAVALSPDGRILASGPSLYGFSSNEVVYLWDTATGAELGQIGSAEDDAVAFAFSPDDKTLASGSSQGTITFWDLASREPVADPFAAYAPGESVVALAFSPDGKALATIGGNPNSIESVRPYLWDLTASPPISQSLISEPVHFLLSLAFSPDGSTLALGGCQAPSGAEEETGPLACPGEILLWDVAAHRPIGEPLVAHSSFVVGLAFSRDGKILASGSLDKTVRLWDLTAEPPTSLALQSGWNFGVAFSPDGALLASAGCGETDEELGSDPFSCQQGEIRLWDAATREPLDPLVSGLPSLVSSIAFNPADEGKTLASGTAVGIPVLWNLAEGERQPLRYFWRNLPSEVVGLTFTGDQTLASLGQDGLVLRWKTDTSRAAALVGVDFLPSDPDFSQNVAVIGPDGQTLALGGCVYSLDQGYCLQGEIRVWDLSVSPPVSRTLSGQGNQITQLVFSADSRRLASTSDQADVQVWDIESGELVQEIPIFESNSLTSLALSPNGQQLAASHSDGAIVVWNVATGASVGELTYPENVKSVYSLAFSPDGQTLASGNADGSILLWDLKTNAPKGQPLIGHTSGVSTLAFSPDGKTLASGSQDSTILLWDVDSLQAIGELNGHTDSIYSLAFSSDGQTLASSGRDRTIYLWDLSPENWQTYACSIAARNLRKTEWNVFFPGRPYKPTCADVPAYWAAALEQAEAYTLSDDAREADSAFLLVTQQATQTTDYRFNLNVCETGVRNQFGTSVLLACEHAVDLALETGEVKQITDACVSLSSLQLLDVARPACDRAVALTVEKEVTGTITAEAVLPLTEICATVSNAGQPDAARPACERAADLASQTEDLFLNHDTCLAAADVGLVDAARPACDRAVALTVQTGDADTNKKICWEQSARGLAANALRACERAVELASEKRAPYPPEYYQDARGLAYALINPPDNYQKAIDDFQAFVDWANAPDQTGKYAPYVRERQRWIIELKEGRDPFNETTLKQIRDDY